MTTLYNDSSYFTKSERLNNIVGRFANENISVSKIRSEGGDALQPYDPFVALVIKIGGQEWLQPLYALAADEKANS